MNLELKKAFYQYEQRQAANRGRMIIRIMIMLLMLVSAKAFRHSQDKPLIIDQNIDIDHQNDALINRESKFGFASVSILMVIISEVTPMAVDDQFIKRVLKYGIPGKEPEYLDDNESYEIVTARRQHHDCYS